MYNRFWDFILDKKFSFQNSKPSMYKSMSYIFHNLFFLWVPKDGVRLDDLLTQIWGFFFLGLNNVNENVPTV